MTETIPAPYINQPAVGYVYVALVSQNGQQRINEVLQSIHEELPDVVWPMPMNALHITLCEVIQSRKIYSEDPDSLFNRRRAEYVDGAAQALADVAPFSVVFKRVEVSRDAIIVQAEDSSVFNDLRAKLLGHITLPTETKQPPDITHSSIARYLKAIDIETVEGVAARHPINFEEPITEFKLLKTLIPPLLKYEEIESYPLRPKLKGWGY